MPAWAYDFVCDLSLDELASILNKAGPWQWQARESYWYGDYLNSRPVPGLRLRIHMYPQSVQDGAHTLTGLRARGYMALLEIDPQQNSATREEIDPTFRELLAGLHAGSITEIEPYD